jgi:hypothetical protein
MAPNLSFPIFLFLVSSAHAVPISMHVSPSSGHGTSQIFTITYTDVEHNGIGQAHFWVMQQPPKTCYVMAQMPTRSIAAGIYLADDSGNILAHNPGAPGSSTTLSNSQCSVSLASSEVKVAADECTFKVALTFTSAFEGVAELKGDAFIASGAESGIVTLGSYTVGTPPNPSGPVSVGPSGALEITSEGAIDIIPAISPRKDVQGDWTGLQYFRGAFVLGSPRLPECKEGLRGMFAFERGQHTDHVRVCMLADGVYTWKSY